MCKLNVYLELALQVLSPLATTVWALVIKNINNVQIELELGGVGQQ